MTSDVSYKRIKVIDCKQGAVRAVRFNVDGSYCLTCGSDKKIKLWNPYEVNLLKTYGGHGNEVLDACSSCDNSQILSCGADKTVILWDVCSGAALRRFRGHASHVLCVRYNEESSFALSGSRDNTVMGWDLRSRSVDPVQILDGTPLVFIVSIPTIAMGFTTHCSLTILLPKTLLHKGKLEKVLRDAKDSITSLQVTDHEILTGSLDCWLRRYDIRTGLFYSDFVGEPIMSVSFTRDAQCAVVASTDSVIRLFDKDSGELLSEYSGHVTGDYVMECGVDQGDRHIVSGDIHGTVWWWELVSGQAVLQLRHSPERPVTSLSVHPSQPRLLTAAANTINLWQPQSEEDTDAI